MTKSVQQPMPSLTAAAGRAGRRSAHLTPIDKFARKRPGVRTALYARVSTDHQSTDVQLRELRAVAESKGWAVVAEFADAGVSGSKRLQDRPRGSQLLRSAVRGEFDIVAAWSVDRLGRSLQDLVGTLGELHGAHLDLYLHQQAIDTRTPAGKALFGMLSVFAEFERSMIVDRVKAGMAKAQAKGTKSGRAIGRPMVDEEVAMRVRELRGQGIGMQKVAKLAGCGVSVVQRLESGARVGAT